MVPAPVLGWRLGGWHAASEELSDFLELVAHRGGERLLAETPGPVPAWLAGRVHTRLRAEPQHVL